MLTFQRLIPNVFTNESILVDPIDFYKLVGSILEIPILIGEHGKDKGGFLSCISFIIASKLICGFSSSFQSWADFVLCGSFSLKATVLGTLLLIVMLGPCQQ